MIVADQSGHKYQIVKAELKQDELHLLDCNSFYALVSFCNDPKKLSFPYIGNRIVATTNPKLIKQGVPSLRLVSGGCIGHYYEEIAVESPDPQYSASGKRIK